VAERGGRPPGTGQVADLRQHLTVRAELRRELRRLPAQVRGRRVGPARVRVAGGEARPAGQPRHPVPHGRRAAAAVPRPLRQRRLAQERVRAHR